MSSDWVLNDSHGLESGGDDRKPCGTIFGKRQPQKMKC